MINQIDSARARLLKAGHTIQKLYQAEGDEIRGVIDGEEVNWSQIQSMMAPALIFNGVEVLGGLDVDEITVNESMKEIRPDGSDRLKTFAMLRELMLGLSSAIVIIKVLSSTMTPAQKTPYQAHFDQLDASLAKAQKIATIRNVGTSFKNANSL